MGGGPPGSGLPSFVIRMLSSYCATEQVSGRLNPEAIAATAAHTCTATLLFWTFTVTVLLLRTSVMMMVTRPSVSRSGRWMAVWPSRSSIEGDLFSVVVDI